MRLNSLIRWRADFQTHIQSFAGGHAGAVRGAAHQATREIAVGDEQQTFRKFVGGCRFDGHFNLAVLRW